MRRTRWFAGMVPAFVVALLSVGCATAAPTAISPTLTPAPVPTATPGPSVTARVGTVVTSKIVYARVNKMRSFLNVHAPTEPGPWPVVLVAHGLMETNSDYEPLASAIAGQGALVYNVDLWLTSPLSTGIQCLACAVRFARATAADYGGDPSRITLVGSSAGAATGAVAALAGDDFPADCVAQDAPALVDAFIGYEGPYDRTLNARGAPIDHTALKDTDPDLWRAINPYTHIGSNRQLQIRLVHGDNADTFWWDVPIEVSREFAQALSDAGYDVRLVQVPGADHGDLTKPSSDAYAVVIQQALELARKQ